MDKISFVAMPNSPRANKGHEDGGGLRLMLDLDEQQFLAWTQLAALRGKLLKFTAEQVPVGE